MIFIAALTFGTVSYMRLPVELMPDIGYPTITVRTTFEGAAPQEVEAQVSQPIEEQLATLDGLVTLESRSRAGSSEIVLGFDWGSDMAAASQTIRESLQRVFLPEEVGRPLILRYDPSLDPFMRLALAADESPPAEDAPQSAPPTLFALRELAEREIKNKVEGIPGVAAVRVQGGFERQIRVDVREDWLAAKRLTLADVRQALAAENVNIAGGSIIEGDVEYLIRTLNQYRGIKDLESVRIRRSDGVIVPLVDVAEIREGNRERDLVTRMNGGEAVQIEIFKEADANIVEVSNQVKGALFGEDALSTNLPARTTLTELDNQADFIELAVGNLQSTAVLGGVLAIAVLFLFLGDARATAVVGLAIPVSIVIGFAPLYLFGISLNLMSLGGLALGVGMLVDNAVVVLEAIDRRRTDDDMSRHEAAIAGTAEVAAAVVASTLTTVAVFLPIAFVEGVAGELFGDLALAVVSSLLASLAVALLAVPMVYALEIVPATAEQSALVRALEGPKDDEPVTLGRRLRYLLHDVVREPLQDWREARAWQTEAPGRLIFAPWNAFRFVSWVSFAFTLRVVSVLLTIALVVLGIIASVFQRFFGWIPARMAQASAERLERVRVRYREGLTGLLERTLTVALMAGVLFLGAMALATQLGTELIPELHQGRFTADIALDVGTPIRRTLARVADAEARVLALPDVTSVYSVVGSDPRVDNRSDRGEHTAELYVNLAPGLSSAAEERVMEAVRSRIGSLEGVTVKVERPSLFSFRTPIEVVVTGTTLDGLRQAGDAALSRLQSIPELTDLRSSLVDGNPEVRINYHRDRLHRLGLDPATVAAQVRDKVQGVEATRIQRGERRVSLWVQLNEPDRSSVDDLRRLNINPNLRPLIPLEAVADFTEGVGPSEVRRVDQQRAVVISANLAAFDLGSARDAIEATLSQWRAPEGIRWSVAGQSEEMAASLGSLQFALGLAVFLVYVIMASTFESLIHPFVILFAVPLALIGAVVGLAMTGQPVSVVVLIGAIVLAGVVVNNAIVLVDSINRQRAEGLDLVSAIRQAGSLRLRPILITTATTVLGLAPLAVGVGAGAEVQSPLAVTVIGGLLSSTVLTLGVVPVLYRLLAVERSSSPDDDPQAKVPSSADIEFTS